MVKTLNRTINRITDLSAPPLLKYICFLFFVVLISVISFFHEPWYDEAQAWQIARCASLYDIFFTIPHFEGHPPLWHLILAPFAKLGLPYEFSLSFVNIIFMSAAVWLIIFKTKLPDIMKLTFPFTYFVFYQYGVVSRPYSVMALSFMLCAVFYKDKEDKPFRMVLSLMLLCATSAYGIVYAFLICIAWLIEIMRGKKFFAFVKDFVKSRTFYSLLLLAFFAVALLLMIFPSKDSLVAVSRTEADALSYVNNYLYTFLIMPFDATIGSVSTADINIFEEDFISAAYIPYFILSIAIYVLLFIYAKKSKKLPLFLPFVLMPLFFGSVFLYAHHIGLFMLYLIFFISVCFGTDEPRSENAPAIFVTTFFITFTYITIIVQLLWTISSCALEITKKYYPSKDIAKYISENDLTDQYILPVGYVIKNGYDITHSAYAVITLPYFDKNIFPTVPTGYITNHYHSEEELKQQLEDVKKIGLPDCIIGYPSSNTANEEDHSDLLFGYIFQNAQYSVVCDIESGMIFKGNYTANYTVIYRKETTNAQTAK